MAKKNKPNRPSDFDDSDHPEDGGKLSPGPGKESFKLAQFWKSQYAAYDQANKRWHKRGTTVIKRFRDERNRIDEEGQRRMNLLWANVKVMKPAIYSKCPDPVVDRKFLDHDPTGRLSCQMLERTLINELECAGYHNAIDMAVLDRLLPGRGVVWIRYVPTIGEGPSIPSPTINGIEDPLYDIGEQTGDKELTEESEEEEKLEETGSQVLKENLEVDYVNWQDFYYFPVKARNWAEIQAVGKKVHISKKEAIERFGEKIGRALKPDTTPQVLGNTDRQTYSDTSVFEDINERNLTVFETWNKSDKRVYWHCTGYDYLCDVVDDPLDLENYFPVPPFLQATVTNDTLVPVPDYIEWQDQAVQIDELTQRLAMLTRACKVAGVYNAAATSVNRIFQESIENELIPVDQWAMFAEAGGLKGVVDFIPIDIIQATIETLLKVRQQAMIDLDQVTGLSDVIRGTSDSRETLGGLRLKNNNAGTRLSESQEAVAKFARDTLRIMAEIICKHFSDETIVESSGILYEEALQPETVLAEFQWEQQQQQGQQPQQPGQGQPQGQPQQPPQQGAPQAPPTPPPQGGMPPMGQQPGSNVIPFKPPQPQVPGAPGGAPQQPGMGAPPPQMPLMPPPPPPNPVMLIQAKIEKALKLLRKDIARGYRIDIETDSTIFGDKAQDKEDATEFITALGSYMGVLEKAIQLPESLPLFAKTLQWGVRKMRVGRDLEAEIDNFCEAMAKRAKQMIANPQPNPEQTKMQIEQMKAQAQKENDQRDAQREDHNHQQEMQMNQQDHQLEVQKMMMEMKIEQQKAQLEIQKMQMQIQALREKNQIEKEKAVIDVHAKQQTAAVDQQMKQQEMQHQTTQQHMDMQHQTQQHQQAMHHTEQEHKAGMQHTAAQHEAGMHQKAAQHKAGMSQKAESHKAGLAQKKATASAGAKSKKGK